MSRIKIRPTIGAVAVTALVCGALPASAAAETLQLPPGNSALNQYIESVPTAGGGKPSGGIKSHHGGKSGGTSAPGATSGSSALSPSTERALSSSGKSGQAAAAFANATAPSTSTGRYHPGGPARAGSGPPRGSAVSGSSAGGTGSSPLNSVLSAFLGPSSTGGLGDWLPALLIVILVAGCAAGFWHRYRRTST